MTADRSLSHEYDAIVVGARCAGSPTAMLLARRGYRVLLVDRASFPSDTISSHAIRMPGVALLHRWGLLDAVAESNCPPVRTVTFDLGDFPLRGTVPPHPDGLAMYAPRRTILDTILVEAAARDGAEVRTGFSVEGLLSDGDRVVGIRGRTKGGRAVEERGRIVVGADGKHSLVARTVGASTYRAVPSLECGYYTYWTGVPTDSFELYVRPGEGRAILVVRTNNDACLIAVLARHSAFRSYRADIAGTYGRGLELVPDLAERVRAGRRVERFYGTGDLPNFFRRPHGPGWALVGDAGLSQDPFPAWGISDAFRDAQLLADAIDAGLSGARGLEEALAAYADRRDALALPLYEETLKLALLGPPPPDQLQLRTALRFSQPDADRFLGVLFGGLAPDEFFSPANLARIMGLAVA